jgi:hypothetical protein
MIAAPCPAYSQDGTPCGGPTGHSGEHYAFDRGHALYWSAPLSEPESPPAPTRKCADCWCHTPEARANVVGGRGAVNRLGREEVHCHHCQPAPPLPPEASDPSAEDMRAASKALGHGWCEDNECRSCCAVADLVRRTRQDEREKAAKDWKGRLRRAISRCICEGLPWCGQCKVDLAELNGKPIAEPNRVDMTGSDLCRLGAGCDCHRPSPPVNPEPPQAPAFFGTPEGYFPVEPRTSEASEAAIARAQEALWTGLEAPGERSAINRVLFDVITEGPLRSLWRAALLKVAKAGCHGCASAAPKPNKHAQAIETRWMHGSGGYAVFCKRPEVWDALQALRGGKA